jgi:tetratricopeptide (TPR) repeat protein
MNDTKPAKNGKLGTLEIDPKSLPPNHPHWVAYYNHIGSLHGQMGNHEEALPYFEKALEVEKQLRLPNDPNLAVC